MKWAAFFFALALIACNKSASINGHPQMFDPIPRVDVVGVLSQKLETTERLPAELAPWEVVAIYPKVEGFVEEIPVDRGSVVHRGQLLARLSAPELAAQTAQAQATMLGDKATFERLRVASHTPGAVSDNQLELAQALFKADEEKVTSLKTLANYLVIVAPFDGTISERNVHPGALVGPPSQPLSTAVPMLRLEQIDHLRLVVPVPQADVDLIPEGEAVRFTVSALPGRYFSGTISRTSHALDPATRTMPVEADVYQKQYLLDPGMFVEVLWPMHAPDPTLFVPSASIVQTSDRTFVDIVEHGRVRRVDVRRGRVMGGLVQVFGELKEGDSVIARGSADLPDGARVNSAPLDPAR